MYYNRSKEKRKGANEIPFPCESILKGGCISNGLENGESLSSLWKVVYYDKKE